MKNKDVKKTENVGIRQHRPSSILHISKSEEQFKKFSEFQFEKEGTFEDSYFNLVFPEDSQERIIARSL